MQSIYSVPVPCATRPPGNYVPYDLFVLAVNGVIPFRFPRCHYQSLCLRHNDHQLTWRHVTATPAHGKLQLTNTIATRDCEDDAYDWNEDCSRPPTCGNTGPRQFARRPRQRARPRNQLVLIAEEPRPRTRRKGEATSPDPLATTSKRRDAKWFPKLIRRCKIGWP